MPNTQINRYIIKELVAPTLLCLVIFTMVMVLGQAFKLFDLIINKGVSPGDILVLLVTLMPTFLSISLPLAFLMGLMIGLGRMSADSETVALKAAGIGLARISLPVFALALVFALLTAATSLWIKPWGYGAFARKSFEIARQKATVGFQPRIFMKQFNNLVLYANEIDARENQMRGLFIVEKQPEATSWVFAERGNILANVEDETLTIRLHDGVIHRQQSESSDNYQLIHFRNYDIQPEISGVNDQSKRKKLKPQELATTKLWSGIATTSEPDKMQKMQAELHLRLISPFAPLLFACFGLPFSMQSHRSGRSGGFVMGLVIFLTYYFILSAGRTVTQETSASPWLTLWIPHLLMAGTGILFLRHAALEKPVFLVSWLDQSMLMLQKRVRKNVDS